MSGEHEPQITPKEIVDQKLGEFLKDEPAGSPVIKACGDIPAQKIHGIEMGRSQDKDFHLHTAMFAAVSETIRKRENGKDADLYIASQDHARDYMDKYELAVKQMNPNLGDKDAEVRGAAYLKSQVSKINAQKASAMRQGHLQVPQDRNAPDPLRLHRPL